MTEENLPEQYRTLQPERRKPKIPTKRHWMEMVKEMTEITPQMDPKEAYKRVQQVKQSANPNLSPERREKERIVEKLREERLKRQGADPSTKWAFYTHVQPEEFGSHNMEAEFTEEDMARWSAKFPKGIELFVIQGVVSPGSEYIAEANPFTIISHAWEIYVRVKPENMIEEPLLQIGNVDEPTK